MELTTDQKLQLRCKALDMAQTADFNNTEALLSIADNIYEWLVKEY